VDQAEKNEGTADRINHGAVAQMAGLCREHGIHMVHISTDFVFNGRYYKPYHPNDTPDPISVYGKSKLNGEEAILHILKDQALIIRTAWLYSSHGNNFVKTMLKLMTEKQSLNIIDEQIGTPTWAHGLAQAIWAALDKTLKGVFHWTDAGVASWYDFAMAIQEEAIHTGLLDEAIPIYPIPAQLYPTPAQRPFYGVLDKTSFWKALDIKPLHWRVQLRSMLKEFHP
jgi:dTDP-4-dehydrorhamnose reductase